MLEVKEAAIVIYQGFSVARLLSLFHTKTFFAPQQKQKEKKSH